MANVILRRSFCQFGVSRRLRTFHIVNNHCGKLFSITFVKGEKTDDMDDLKKNSFYSKYADKIAKLQQASPEEFLKRLETTEKVKKKTKNDVDDGTKEFSLPTKPKSDVSSSSASYVSEKKLSDIMTLELIKDKSGEEIGAIWKEFHQNKDSLCAVIPAETWLNMSKRFQYNKTFLLPLPRKQGYEFFVVQFAGKEAHFTSLINYQAHHENAPECLTLFHYTDLLDDKGIVLMLGQYDKNLLTIQECQCLANQVEIYYYNPSPEKEKLLDLFTNKPSEFKHIDLISQLENISFLTDKPSTIKEGSYACENS